MKKMEEILSEAAEKLRGGDEKRVQTQHSAGKLTARERVNELMDAGSFMELETLRKESNVVAGFGTVHGRAVYCVAQDFASQSGAMTAQQAEKIRRTLSLAEETGAPIVLMPDSAGVKVTEGPLGLPAYADVMAALARISGVSPILCYAAGQCTGIGVLMTQLADITVQVKKIGHIALSSTSVMNTVKGKALDEEALFGADNLGGQGMVALTAADEQEGLTLIKQLLDALPASNMEEAPLVESDDLNRTLEQADALDAIGLVSAIADDGRAIELFKMYGKAAHTVLCRIGGRSAGVVATEPKEDGGRLDAQTCGKIARFVRLCDCYDIPVITLVNTEGLAVPAVPAQAWSARTAAQMLYAYAEATCPKVSVITGNAIGAAYVAMGGKAMADVRYAWADAVIAPLTAPVAAAAFDDNALTKGENREVLETRYSASCNAVFAAENALIDEVIRPDDTRKMIIAAMEYLSVKRSSYPPKKHGNMPL